MVYSVAGQEGHYGKGSFLTQCKERFGVSIGEKIWTCVNQAFDYLPLVRYGWMPVCGIRMCGLACRQLPECNGTVFDECVFFGVRLCAQAAVVDDSMFCVHGGIPRRSGPVRCFHTWQVHGNVSQRWESVSQ